MIFDPDNTDAVQVQPVIAIVDEAIYDTRESGTILKREPATMRNSRHTGKLAGVEAPAHIKIGSRAYYRGRALREWLAQFKEQVTARPVALDSTLIASPQVAKGDSCVSTGTNVKLLQIGPGDFS